MKTAIISAGPGSMWSQKGTNVVSNPSFNMENPLKIDDNYDHTSNYDFYSQAYKQNPTVDLATTEKNLTLDNTPLYKGEKKVSNLVNLLKKLAATDFNSAVDFSPYSRTYTKEQPKQNVGPLVSVPNLDPDKVDAVTGEYPVVPQVPTDREGRELSQNAGPGLMGSGLATALALFGAWSLARKGHESIKTPLSNIAHKFRGRSLSFLNAYRPYQDYKAMTMSGAFRDPKERLKYLEGIAKDINERKVRLNQWDINDLNKELSEAQKAVAGPDKTFWQGMGEKAVDVFGKHPVAAPAGAGLAALLAAKGVNKVIGGEDNGRSGNKTIIV